MIITLRHPRLINLNIRRRSRRPTVTVIPVLPLISERRGKKLEPIKPYCHSVMKYTIPSLLAFVALKYQDRPESLIVENPTPIWCFLVTTCVYWVIVGGLKQMPSSLDTKYLLILSHVAFAIGILSALSLLSAVLPHRIWVVPFIIWIPLPIVLTWPMICGSYTWLRSQITTLFDILRAKMVSRETSLSV